MKRLFSPVVLCSVFSILFFRTACGQIPATINGAGTWSASTGSGSVTFAAGQCYEVTVEAWGGGGGGGGAANDGASGGGAGGGFAQGAVTILGGSTCFYSVGAGGTAGTTAGNNGGNGGPTWFNGTPGTNNNTTGSFINAGGGAGGNGETTNVGAAAQTTVGTGSFGTTGVTDTASYSGGTGGGGFVSGSGDGGGGGGGGGAGTGGNGGNGATTIVGGTGAFGCPNGGGGGGGGGGGATGAGANGNPGNNNGGGGTGGAANGGGAGGTADGTAAGLGGNGTAGGPGNPLGGGGGAGNGCCGCSGGAGGDGAAGSGSIGGGGGGGTGDGGGGNGGNGGAHGGGGAGADGSSSASGGTGGGGYLSITVALVPPPTATAGPAQAAICQGATTTIMNGSVSAGATALWSGGAGTWTNPTDPVNATYTAGATETGTITLTLTATSACGTGTATETLTINPSPVAPTVTSPVTYCQNAAPAALTATGAGSLLWYTVATGGTGSGTAPTPVTTSTGQTTYYVSQTVNGCESARDSIVVVVNALPAASANNTGPYCSNGTITLTASGGASYSWSGPNSYSGTGASPAPFSAATYGPGTYTVTVTDANTCTATASTSVAVNTPPTAVFTTNSPICISQTLNVTYTGTGTGGANYAWTFNGGNPSTSNVQAPPAVSYSASGTDSVSLTVSENGCSSDTTIAVTITPLPTSTFIGPPVVCTGQQATYTYTGNASASAAYNWGALGGTPATFSAQGPYNVTWSTAGNVGVALYVVENGCNSDTTLLPVTINATPVSNPGDDTTICSGATANLGGPAIAGNTYAWTPTIGLSSSSVANPTITLNNTTSSSVVSNYVVTTTSTAGNCSSSDTVAVTVSPAVVLGAPVVQNDSCYGQSNGCITATVTTGTAPYAYQWSTGIVGQSSQLCNLPAGSYAFTVTDGNGCSDSLSNIMVTQPDSLTITTTVTPVSCPGQTDGTILAALTGGTQPYVYNWSNNAGNINPDINLAVGNYSVTVNDANNCTISATATITVLPALGLTDVIQNVLCIPLTDGVISVSVTSNFPPITYAWSNGATDSTVTGLAAGSYSVTVSDSHNCSADTTLSVGIASSYAITALPHDTTINLGGQVPITVNANGGGVAAVSWEPPYGLSCINCDAPVASPAQTTRYTVTITSDSGCTAVDTVYVEVVPVHEIYVPNVFAPGSNGANSTFQVFGNKEAWQYFDISIFDRWGEKVFESHDMDFDWDGTYKGEPAPQAVYVYEIHVVYMDGYTGKVFTGSITLLR